MSGRFARILAWPGGGVPNAVSGSAGWRIGVPLAALVAGLLFAASATTSHGVDLRVTGRDDVTTLAAREQHTVLAQGRQLAALQHEVQVQAAQVAGSDNRVATARAQSAAVASAAGLAPASGAALTVSLNDAPPLPGAQKGAVPPDYLVVHQQDVQAVVNALWAGGAQAMTLQGQRVISTTAVRCVGNTLLLQNVVYSPPYVVSAIGDPARLRAALDAAPDVVIYKQYVDAYKLGFKVEQQAHVTMPAYAGPMTLEHAQPLDAVQ